MALATIAEVKTYLGRDYSGGKEDAFLEAALEAAIQYVKTATDRELESKEYTLAFVGRGRACKMLEAFPVRSVTSVTIDGAAVPAKAAGVAGWYVDGPRVALSGGLTFPEGSDCSIVYVAGYADDAIPRDLALATVQLAVYFHRERDRLGVFSRQDSASGFVQFQVVSLPIGIKSVLDSYAMRSAG